MPNSTTHESIGPTASTLIATACPNCLGRSLIANRVETAGMMECPDADEATVEHVR